MVYKSAIWSLCAALFASMAAFGQLIHCKSYTIADGLVANNVRNLYQDADGFIWIGTWGGLSRYDGHRFTNFTEKNGLTNNLIVDMTEIFPGMLLVAQNNGTTSMIEDSRISTLFQSPKYGINQFLKIDPNQVWGLTEAHGILEINKNGFTIIQASENIVAGLLMPLGDSMWVGQKNASITIYSNKWKTISGPSPPEITKIYTDSQKRTWVGTNKGLKLLSSTQKPKQVISYDPLPKNISESYLRSAQISSFYEDAEHNLWVGTADGLYMCPPEGQVLRITKTEGLPSNIITCVLQDTEKNIWVGTSAGVAKITRTNAVTVIGTAQGLPSHLDYSLLKGNNNEILLFGKQLIKLQIPSNQLTHIREMPAIRKPHFEISDSEVLVLEKKGASIYKTGSSVAQPIPWPSGNTYHAIARMTESTYIAGKEKGFEIVTPPKTMTDSLSIPQRITCFTKDKHGQIWAGTFGHGLYRINLTKYDTGYHVIANRMLAKELPDSSIRALFADAHGNIWVGTRFKGVICIKKNISQSYQLLLFDQDKGLSSDWISQVTEDGKGNIWIGTSQGFDKLIPVGDSYRVFNFSRINGVSFSINQLKFIDSRVMVAAGLDGVVIGRDDLLDTTPPQKAFITQVYASLLKSKHGAVGATSFLSHNKPNISFAFASPQFFNEALIQFSHRLLGTSDTSWIIADQSRTVNYASLQPGHYTFEVRASGWNGQWSPPSSFTFTVTTPYWQKPWFLIAVLLLIGGLFYIFYNYRIKQLLRLQQVRNAIATDLHDDIGSALTNINILSALSRSKLEQPKEAIGFLHRISEEVNGTLQALDDIIWSVNSRNDNFSESVSRMRRYAAELLDADNIEYAIDMDEAIASTKLTMQQRRDLYLLFKECLNNISKHAQASKVDVQVGIDGSHIILRVRDNGQGFDREAASFRNGLLNMQNRVSRWNGKLLIETATGAGTFIEAKMPLAKTEKT